MNTTGHHGVSEVGKEILQTALENVGRGHPRLGAFYLGNWLTDVSQVRDEIGYNTFKSALKSAVGDAFQGARNLLSPIADRVDRKAIDAADYMNKISKMPIIGDGLEAIDVAEEYWAGKQFTPVQDLARAKVGKAAMDALTKHWDSINAAIDTVFDESIGSTFEKLFRVAGYFKFCHPVTQPGKAGRTGGRLMDFDAYLAIFEERFTGYFPHEHIDRPEDLTKRSSHGPTYASDVNEGLGIYEYMREHLEIAAGSLARLDHDWAFQQFRFGKPVDDQELDFNRHLAALGHTLHVIEDFFAHSNFVEHAAAALGPEWLNRGVMGEITPAQASTFLKRLQKVKRPGWKDEGAVTSEEFVVTGYFDFNDTLCSLGHALEEVIGEQEWLDKLGEAIDERAKSPVAKVVGKSTKHGRSFLGAKADDTLEGKAQKAERKVQSIFRTLQDPSKVEEEYTKLLYQSLEALSDPASALEDPTNEVAQKIRTELEQYQFKEIPPSVSRKILEGIDLPDSIADDFVQAVDNFAVCKKRLGVARSVYKALKHLMMFLTAPQEEVRKFLRKEIGDYLFDEFVNTVIVEPVAAYLKIYVYNKIAAGRRGCHSLLAKDTGHEPLALYSTECAKAVHSYVVETLVRSGATKQALASRTGNGQCTERKNVKENRHWIDWKDLLFFHLRHPTLDGRADARKVIGMEMLGQTLVGETLEVVFQRYRSTSANSASFTMEKLLQRNPHLYPYAFLHPAVPPGTFLLVPDQRVEWYQRHPSEASGNWWIPIFKCATSDVFRVRVPAIDNDHQCVIVDYHEYTPVCEAAVIDLGNHGKSLEDRARQKYKVAWCG